MDSSGQYVVACSPSGVYRSTNYGASFSLIKSVTSSTSCWCTSDSSGSYIGVSTNSGGSGYIMLSTNGGSSFSSTTTSWANANVASNSDGSVMILSTNTGAIYVTYSFAALTVMNSTVRAWSAIDLNPAGKQVSDIDVFLVELKMMVGRNIWACGSRWRLCLFSHFLYEKPNTKSNILSYLLSYCCSLLFLWL